jgi:hypothetical protein
MCNRPPKAAVLIDGTAVKIRDTQVANRQDSG